MVKTLVVDNVGWLIWKVETFGWLRRWMVDNVGWLRHWKVETFGWLRRWMVDNVVWLIRLDG